MRRLIAQGAEARIYRDKNRVIKERIKKNYRIKEIDEKLRKLRTRAESRLIKRAQSAGLKVPEIIEKKGNNLIIEYINGEKLRDYLERTKDYKIMSELGKNVLKLHKENIIHGDLTTSNLIKKDNYVYFIDFGLSQFSEKIEDKAVDLHLFKECLKSKHYSIWKRSWSYFIKEYNDKDVFKRLKRVESRGRYKK